MVHSQFHVIVNMPCLPDVVRLVHVSIDMYAAEYTIVMKGVSDVQDLLQSREAAEAARCAFSFARNHVQDTLQASANMEGWAQVSLDTLLRQVA